MNPALEKNKKAAPRTEPRLELEPLHNAPDADPDAATSDDALDLVNHLLWHKSLIDENDGGERLDEYIGLVRASDQGEHLTIDDPFDKSIAIAFELVLQQHLNPWKIDLGEFSRMYLQRAGEERLELVTAGRIILMAWTVLKLQSDEMVEAAERLAAPPEEIHPDMLDWGDIGDWDYDDEDVEYTMRVKHAPVAPIDEKIRRKGASRKVTLMELVDAFEEIRREAEERQVLMAERKRMREWMRKQANDSVEDMMHADDPEADQAVIWERIAGRNGDAIRFREIHRPHIDDFTTAFTSVLHLAAERRIDLWQEEFPFGPIMLRNNDAVDADKDQASPAPEEQHGPS